MLVLKIHLDFEQISSITNPLFILYLNYIFFLWKRENSNLISVYSFKMLKLSTFLRFFKEHRFRESETNIQSITQN